MSLIIRLTERCARFPRSVLVACLATSLAALLYAGSSLGFKTSRAALIDPETDYHQRWLRYTAEFGDAQDLIVVAEAATPERILAAIDRLGPRIEQDTRFFKNVLFRIDLRQLKQAGLQLLSAAELERIEQHVREAQACLAVAPNGLFLEQTLSLLDRACSAASAAQGLVGREAASRVVEQGGRTAASLRRFLTDPRDYRSPWQANEAEAESQPPADEAIRYLMNSRQTMGFIKLQPVEAASDFAGANPCIARLRELLAELQQQLPDVRLSLTGIPVLESDEMAESQTSMLWASVLSTVGVAALLISGFRGCRYPILSMVLLGIGTAWSLGAATFFVGHLNILSVSFMAMLVGLGVDFAIVYLARYLEVRTAGEDPTAALRETAASTGPGILTAAATASVAFFAAMFTDFTGIAELGLITGWGILLCIVATFVALPAMLRLCDRGQAPSRLPPLFRSRTIPRLTARAPRLIIAGSLAGIVVLGGFSLNVRYDHNLLHMQAEGVESVKLQNRIFEQANGSMLFAASIAESPAEAIELKRRFEALPSVHHVEEIASMLPRLAPADAERLQRIHDLLKNTPPELPAMPAVNPAGIGRTLESLDHGLLQFSNETAHAARRDLDFVLTLLDGMSLDEQVQSLQAFQAALAMDVHLRLQGLAAASSPHLISLRDLPPALAARFVSPRGHWLLAVYPREQIWDVAPLEQFVRELRTVDPDVTGTPVQNLEASRAIQRSYGRAGLYALAAVSALLLLDFRNVWHAAFALLPPSLGFLMTLGILGASRIDLNPANMILVPLILGIGVDGGVHVVHDFRLQHGRWYRISPSTFSGVVLTATTSMVGFGSLMIAAHRGLFSLGFVLTVGVTCSLFIALVVLPAILTLVNRSAARGQTVEKKRPGATEPAPPFAAVA